MVSSVDTPIPMKSFLITFTIVWAVGFFAANHLMTAVDSKLDSLQSQRDAQFCQIDESFCS